MAESCFVFFQLLFSCLDKSFKSLEGLVSFSFSLSASSYFLPPFCGCTTTNNKKRLLSASQTTLIVSSLCGLALITEKRGLSIVERKNRRACVDRVKRNEKQLRMNTENIYKIYEICEFEEREREREIEMYKWQ